MYAYKIKPFVKLEMIVVIAYTKYNSRRQRMEALMLLISILEILSNTDIDDLVRTYCINIVYDICYLMLLGRCIRGSTFYSHAENTWMSVH